MAKPRKGLEEAFTVDKMDQEVPSTFGTKCQRQKLREERIVWYCCTCVVNLIHTRF